MKYKEENKDINNSERKYTYVPKEFEHEYEWYLKKENLKKEFAKRMREEYKENKNNLKQSSNKDNIEQAIMNYCKSKDINQYKKIENNKEIILKYVDKEGNVIIEKFTKEELLKNNVINNKNQHEEDER